jgi:hypothetical protein|tara:strand:- start:1448 stop:2110 length:663 start_codon:yes stop_codon:yes gene_type:complete
MIKINYEAETYCFKQIIEYWFEQEGILPMGGLSTLHYEKSYDLFERKNDQSTIWHKCFYKNIREDSSFDEVYVDFLNDVIKPRFNEQIVYQKIPTFRVHLPGNIAVGEFHKDKHYRDEEWANKVQEINYFLPLTKAYGTNTIWAETEEDLGDYREIRADYGECVEWSASKLTHGNKQNITSVTRVSFDFRVIRKSRYVESNHLTINTKTPFGIGGYYEVL